MSKCKCISGRYKENYAYRLLIRNKEDIPRIKRCVADNDIEILDIFETVNKRDPMRNRFC
jgi:hypothetical protein